MRKILTKLISIFLFISLVFPQATITSKRNYYVNYIYFYGNKNFEDKILKKNLIMKEKGLISKSIFNRRILELDKINLTNFYKNNGFLECIINDSISIEDNLVNVYFFIVEGKRYYLKSLKITGTRQFSERQLRKYFDVKNGEPFNQHAIRTGLNKILSLYLDKGYLNVKMKDKIQIEEDNQILFKLSINEGSVYKIGNIDIQGLKTVKPNIVLREMIIKSGDIYSKEKIEKSRRYIYETGLFSSVNITISSIDTVNKIAHLNIILRELEKRYLGLSIGFGQDRGISAGSEPYTSFDITSEWLHRYLTNRGTKLNVKLIGSLNLSSVHIRPKTDFEITYTEPWLFKFRSLTSVKTFFNNQIYQNQEITNYGQEYSLTYRKSKRKFIKTAFEIRRVIYSYSYGSLISRQRDVENSINIIIYEDNRDNFLYPSNGTFFNTTAKLAGIFPFSTTKYYKLETTFNHYTDIYKNIIWANRVKIGIMDNLGKKATPEYEIFYLGGSTSLRAWLDREYLIVNKRPVGGNLKVIFNTELRFPIVWIMGGELFIDIGDLQYDIKDVNKIELSIDAGFGLTFATPLGPLRIDYAKILKSRVETKTNSLIQFALQYAF
ncbi:MAG: BamA/TamA family outer membrane protein [Candidatus Marinimicrobia bacterium]|nr:BamA/TamA family outer membrane protein [Candidatus Neomarinimicrobiota bacterium]